MTPAKKFAAVCAIVAVLATATPTLAAGPSIFSQAGSNLTKGVQYYARTVSDWFGSLTAYFRRLLPGNATAKKLGATCAGPEQCPGGLACLNACPENEPDCNVAGKRCAPYPKELRTVGRNGRCTLEDACVADTFCTKVCPPGITCKDERLCLLAESPGGTCKQDQECLDDCSDRPLPPIGAAAWAPTCQQGTCRCQPVEISLDLPRVACPAGLMTALICPEVATPGCTLGGCANGPCPSPRQTCLRAPEFGGQCLKDAECAVATCPAGTSPFCSDGTCKCRSVRAEIVRCGDNDDCASAVCEANQTPACINGVCACGIKLLNDDNGKCEARSDCQGTCPDGYDLACVTNRCACQRTVQKAVSCVDLDDCGAVSCPADFNKTCLNGTCACARTSTP